MSDRPQDPEQTPADAAALRRLAEEQAGATNVAFPVGPTPESIQQMFHELRVHQIELEMQNEELRRAQVELEATRTRYFDLYDLAPVGYCTLSEKGLILEANLTAASLLGVSRSELVQQPLTRFIIKEDQDALYLHRKQLLETGSPQTCELRLQRTDGEVCWTRLDATAAQGADGTTTCRVVLSDITERKQAERKLQESKHLTESVVENVPLMIFLKEAEDLRFVVFNRAGEELLGYDRGDFLGKSDLDLFPPEQAAHFMAKDREALSEGVLVDIPEEQILTAKKGTRLLHTRKVSIKGVDGVTKYLLGISEDITERRQAETEREQLQFSLAQSDRLASMGTLAAGVAHEINNPLTYVLYNLESVIEDLPRLAEWVRRCNIALLKHLDHDSTTRALGCSDDAGVPAAMEDVISRLRDAASGAQRIKQITRGLSTFSRVDQEAVAPVAIESVIEQVLSIASNQIKFRARVVKDYSPLPAVLATDGKLAQVFLNLVVNAAQSIDEGHVEQNEIRIRTWTEGDAVFAEVSDTGKGISPEHWDRVFDPFFTTKEIGVGSGLGLSITKNIVTGFGGEISFSSEAGKGTRFLVRLPSLPMDWQADETAAPADVTIHAAKRGRILVVDDEPGIRAIIARMLGHDHEVVAAASGEEGQALLEKDRNFDLIFCDLMMPRTSGMELHAWLAERDADLARQVVFITGGAFTHGATAYLARVGNLRVEKPFDTIAFKKLTDELLLAAGAKRGA